MKTNQVFIHEKNSDWHILSADCDCAGAEHGFIISAWKWNGHDNEFYFSFTGFSYPHSIWERIKESAKLLWRGSTRLDREVLIRPDTMKEMVSAMERLRKLNA